MKKQLQLKGAIALFIGLSLSLTSVAQTNTNSNLKDPASEKGKEQPYYENTNSRVSTLPIVLNPKTSGKEAVLWTEDFANGFTNSTNGAWTTGGTNANFVEYDTDGPDNLLQFGWGPLPSPSAANGFAIFDFYDRFPDPNGFATSPADATLTSPVIDLGVGTTDAQITMFMQLYNCCHATEKNMKIEISTDGGSTFPNEIIANADFDRNERHWNLGLGYEFRWKISDYIVDDPTNVVLRFSWVSTTADANGQYDNTYFWMIDDIEISNVPPHSLEFVALPNGAPAHDVIFGGDGANSKHGIMADGQSTNIGMDGNILNYGTITQTDVKLEVKILDDQDNVVTTLTSATGGTIAEDDTLDFNTAFTSGTFDPTVPGPGVYRFIYSATSDSSGVAGFEVQSDTFTFVNTDNTLHSIDWNAFSNNHGTNELGDDGSAMASRLFFPNPNLDTNNFVYLESIDVRFSTQSTAGGEVLMEIQDTSIDLTTGFNNGPLFSKTFDVTNAMVGSTGTFDIRDSVWNAWTQTYDKFGHELDANNSYYIVAYLFSNAGASPVQLANDQTFPQPSFASIMYDVAQARWFTGYLNSLTFNAPWLRARIADTPPANIGLNENTAFDFDVYPNPVLGSEVNVQLSEGGAYSLELVNTVGQLVKTQDINVNGNETTTINVSDLAKGVYVLNIKGGNVSESVKITIK